MGTLLTTGSAVSFGQFCGCQLVSIRKKRECHPIKCQDSKEFAGSHAAVKAHTPLKRVGQPAAWPKLE